jgi:hypothetical protein
MREEEEKSPEASSAPTIAPVRPPDYHEDDEKSAGVV